MRRFLFTLLALSVLVSLVTGAALAAGPLVATVDGPTALAPGQTAQYNVTISGGPTGNVTYSLSYHISGSNTTGGTPLESSPGRASGNQTTFHINITAPTAEQSLTLTVTAEALPKTGAKENVTTSYPIAVIKAIVLSATFHNSGTTAATNVTVRWYVDDAFVGTTSMARVAANGDATVTFNYVPVNLQPGQHTVRAEADLDHDGVVNPARGEVVTSTLFYNQVQGYSTGWTVLLGIGIFVPVFFGVVAVRRRGRP